MDQPVAAGALRLVDCPVHLVQEAAGLLAEIEARPRRRPDGAGADADGDPARPGPEAPADVPPELLAERPGTLLVGVGQEHHELLAAVAGDGVRRADRAREELPQAHQEAVPRRVAEAVVVLLEPIEVEEQEGDGLPGAAGALDLLHQPLVEVPAVREAREGVGPRQASQGEIRLPEAQVGFPQEVGVADDLALGVDVPGAAPVRH
ncbi:MAG TPA: hypothetical protein VF150_00535 [Thermoanaerobaculia bacterium]